MPLFLASLIGALVDVAGTLVGKVLISLGIGYVAFTGVDTSIEWARDYALNSLGGLPARTLAVAGALKIGTAISIITSGLTTRMLLNGMTGGTIRRMIQKN